MLITRPIQSLLTWCSRDETRDLPNDQKNDNGVTLHRRPPPTQSAFICCSSLREHVVLHPDVSIRFGIEQKDQSKSEISFALECRG